MEMRDLTAGSQGGIKGRGSFHKTVSQTNSRPLAPVCVPTSQAVGGRSRWKPYFKGSDLLSMLGDPGGNRKPLPVLSVNNGKETETALIDQTVLPGQLKLQTILNCAHGFLLVIQGTLKQRSPTFLAPGPVWGQTIFPLTGRRGGGGWDDSSVLHLLCVSRCVKLL